MVGVSQQGHVDLGAFDGSGGYLVGGGQPEIDGGAGAQRRHNEQESLGRDGVHLAVGFGEPYGVLECGAPLRLSLVVDFVVEGEEGAARLARGEALDGLRWSSLSRPAAVRLDRLDHRGAYVIAQSLRARGSHRYGAHEDPSGQGSFSRTLRR